MNTVTLLIYIVIALVAIYVVSQLVLKLYSKSSRTVNCVLAGDVSEHQVCQSHTDKLRPFESFRFKGKRIDPSEYILARVEGECMHIRGIHSGNIVFIHQMSDDEKRNIKDGSILYIRSVKDGVENFLLREYIKDSSTEEVVATRFYRLGYESKESEPHHSLDNVIGVVRYCFE